MTYEELKAEAKAQGYNLIKINKKEKLLPCTCGSKRREHRGWFDDVSREYFESLVCSKCGKRSPGGTNDAEVIRNWNEMIRKEVGDE